MKPIKPFNFIHGGTCEFKAFFKNPVLLLLLLIHLLVEGNSHRGF